MVGHYITIKRSRTARYNIPAVAGLMDSTCPVGIAASQGSLPLNDWLGYTQRMEKQQKAKGSAESFHFYYFWKLRVLV
jgi:hypothetical protein